MAGAADPANAREGASRKPTENRLAKTRRKVGAYIALTKPRVIELLLVTTFPSMVLAQGGLPDLLLVLLTMIGGAIAAGGAGVLNCYIDRDIDEVMNRTKRRPLVTGDVTPREALVFGWVLSIISLAWFYFLVNWQSAVLTAGAIAIYVVGYTIILKRRTAQNIVWGGLAGCMPVFIGWSAVTEGLSWGALMLFLVIFFWTPPHYWPLSMKFKRDYANAGVPMLPVVANDKRVAVEMILYTVAMIASSLGVYFFEQDKLTPIYPIAALVLGVWFLWSIIAMYRKAAAGQTRKIGEMKVFHGSITYLTLLFVVLAVDVFLPF
jgi:protoheme IX farnesyltransferase